MADYDTGKDILTDVLSRSDDYPIGQAMFEVEARRYIQRAHGDLVREFPWSFTVKYPPLQLLTKDKIDVGATVTRGSTTVTLDADPGDVTGRKLRLDRDGISIRVLSNSGATLTLAAGYPKDDGASLSGRIIQDEYEIATDIAFVGEWRDLSNNRRFTPLPLAVIRAEFGYAEGGDVEAYSFITDSVVCLARIPDESVLIETVYHRTAPKLDFSGDSATDTPLFPIGDRWIIADFALRFALQDLDDTRADSVTKYAFMRLAELKAQELQRRGAIRIWFPDGARVGVT